MENQIKINGEVTLSLYDITSPEAVELQTKIENSTGKKYRELIKKLHNKFLKKKIVVKNLCPIVGRAVLAARLAGTLTYSGEINYCALGTDSTNATDADTSLGTEIFRKSVSSATYNDNITYISTFFTATEVSGTIEEVGHFIDGGPDANTGQIFSRIEDSETAELPVTKSDTESLTIDYKVTIL